MEERDPVLWATNGDGAVEEGRDEEGEAFGDEEEELEERREWMGWRGK